MKINVVSDVSERGWWVCGEDRGEGGKVSIREGGGLGLGQQSVGGAVWEGRFSRPVSPQYTVHRAGGRGIMPSVPLCQPL